MLCGCYTAAKHSKHLAEHQLRERHVAPLGVARLDQQRAIHPAVICLVEVRKTTQETLRTGISVHRGEAGLGGGIEIRE